MNSNELRAKFLEFFQSKAHTIVSSSPLVPGNDPTLLFTNAGMVQFKDVFTGQDKRPYVRAASSQKCVRAGGKHNDLENVGYTARHHTFFEMLGNFSFGDYFKKDAIHFAWDFITGETWLGIDKKRLLVTVYHSDDEAYEIWNKEIGLPPERIVRIGDNKGAKYASDNFWAMGDTGPCGPCTEIFYDHDPDGKKGIWGGPPGSPEEDGDRWIEIWNVVFMQFERYKDGTMVALPKPSVDTGMGLERISALMQGQHDNYQTDTFRHLITAIAKLAGQKPYENASQKVIADHIRATSFLITDGVMPSNEGRGYVLRRVMRRAIRHGYKLGLNEPFFYKLVAPLAEIMGGAYPELNEKRTLIEKTIRAEEDSFAVTLDKGMKLFEEFAGTPDARAITQAVRTRQAAVEAKIANTIYAKTGSEQWVICVVPLPQTGRPLSTVIGSEPILTITPGDLSEGQAQLRMRKALVLFSENEVTPEEKRRLETEFQSLVSQDIPFEVQFCAGNDLKVIDGFVVFRLYDTYGFPVDLTADIARERGLKIDEAGYEIAMEAQRDRARAASKFSSTGNVAYEGADTCFVGYDGLVADGAKVLALYRDGKAVDELKSGDDGIVVLDNTPFYAEGGGQVGDKGTIGNFVVVDTQKIKGSVFGHHGTLNSGSLKVGDVVLAGVTESVRRATMRNHSATHLLHRVLRDVLGTHVAQKGSLVNEQRTRFDFSHTQPVTADELAEIETRVNRAVLANVEVSAKLMSYDDAIKSGAMALFGEKYGDEVRVLAMGEHSTELCGGTHVSRTGDIGLFKILSEGGVAAGVRRIEATTGEGAMNFVRETEAKLKAAADLVRSGRDDLVDKVQGVLDRSKQLEKELAALKGKMASAAGGDLASQAKDVKGVKVIAAKLDGVEGNDLRTLMDQLKDKLGSGIVLLGSANGDKVSLIAGVTADLTSKVKAGELVNFVATQVGGKGGGRPDMAQAGGTQPANLPAAVDSVLAWVEGKL